MEDGEGHWKCIRCNYLFRITKTLYREALSIYLKHAYPDGFTNLEHADSMLRRFSAESIRNDKMSWLDHPCFWDYGIPSEARYGNYFNGNMKMRVIKDAFLVDCNDGPDPKEYRERNREVKSRIEADWLRASLPVLR